MKIGIIKTVAIQKQKGKINKCYYVDVKLQEKHLNSLVMSDQENQIIHMYIWSELARKFQGQVRLSFILFFVVFVQVLRLLPIFCCSMQYYNWLFGIAVFCSFRINSFFYTFFFISFFFFWDAHVQVL
jgi:hypothetical protein